MNTYLSPSVHNLIRNVGLLEEEGPTDVSKYIDVVLDLDKIGELLPEPEDTPEYFYECTKKLAPVFKEAEDGLSALDLQSYQQKYDDLNNVTGNQQVCGDVHTLLRSHDVSDNLLGLLLITASIDSSLGDIYCTYHGGPCPSLLKDLLISPELENIVGKVIIQILRVVIGPPISLNLRNVVWHGFPKPGEIPKRYGYFLLLLMSTIGHFLQRTSSKSVIQRQKMKFACTEEYNDLLKDIDTNSDGMRQFLSSCDLYGQQYQAVEHALELHIKKQYGFAAALILPQFETAMRLVFASVNRCPDRVMTAEATTLYTTFDEILDPLLPDGKENCMQKALGENFLDMVHDLLIYPNGPRVRDKLSHGETDFYTFPESLPKAIIITLCAFTVQQQSLGTCLTGIQDNNFIGICKEFVQGYESVFHPMSVVKKRLKDVRLLLSTFPCKVQLTDALEPWTHGSDRSIFTNDERKKSFEETYSKCIKLCDVVFDHWEPNCPVKYRDVRPQLVSEMSDCDFLSALLDLRLRTLYMFQKEQNIPVDSSSDSKTFSRESEIVSLLQHIVDEAHSVITQTIQTLVARQQLFVAKQLRSRQRDNLNRLIISCPFLHQALVFVLVILTWQLYTLKCRNYNGKFRVRFLKSMLQFVENLRTFTHSEKNKWKECVDLWTNFIDKTDNSFIDMFVNK